MPPMTNLLHDLVAHIFEFLQDINIMKEMILIDSFRALTPIVVRDVGRRALAAGPARHLGQDSSKSPLNGLSLRVPGAKGHGVVFGSGMPPQLTTVGGIEEHQFSQEDGAGGRDHLAQVLLDTGPLAGLPSRFEAVTHLLKVQERRPRHGLSTVESIAFEVRYWKRFHGGHPKGYQEWSPQPRTILQARRLSSRNSHLEPLSSVVGPAIHGDIDACDPGIILKISRPFDP